MATNADTPSLGPDFLAKVDRLEPAEKITWYMCVIINLGALNYPDVIPEVWSHIESRFFPALSHDERFQATQKFREGLIKSCGIMGAAKVRYRQARPRHALPRHAL